MIRKFLFFFITVCSLLLTACSDEPFSLPGADGRTTINLLIPSTEMARENTRAESSDQHGEVAAEEGAIKQLAVAGFYTEGGTKKHFFAELTEDMSTEVEDVYRSYKLQVVPADYTLYVLANIPVEGDLKTNLEKSETVAGLEDDVKALLYEYGQNLPVAASGLPMAKSISAEVKDGQEKQVVANLEFVCAKVRLTVIYNNAFGDKTPFKINNVDVLKAYTTSEVFNAGSMKESTKNYTGWTGTHYELSAAQAAEPLSYWTAMPDDLTKDPLNGFTTVKSGSGGWTSFAWQATMYVPECVGTTEANTTHLQLKTAKGNPLVKFGCGNPASNHDENVSGDIQRGHFYDVVAMVADNGEVEYSWRVVSWNAKDLAVQLAGISNLYVAKTEINLVDGDEPVEVEYATDAPSLTFESSKVKYGSMTSELPLFKVTEDRANGVLIVNVNPDLPLRQDHLTGDDMGFWVIAGNIRKWVAVKEVDLTPYLRLLPSYRSLSIANIVNEPDYSLWFDYSTNADNLKLMMSAYNNENTQKGYDQTNSKGIYIEICASDSTAITNRIDIKALNTSVPNNLFNTSYLKEGNRSFPNSGFIKVTLVDPTDVSCFSKEIDATFSASASGVESKKAELEIVPNPSVYTIHFKAINGTTWDSPHIYVYQPLYYNGYPVFGYTGSKNINWLEYDFTGNRAFKGWKKDGGSIDNITGNTTSITFGGEDVTGYSVGTDWGNPGEVLPDEKYMKVQLVDYTQSTCGYCKSGSHPGKNGYLWPGIGMTEEENGWWKIDLPLIVKPGQALVMFTNGHTTDPNARYPLENDPGILIPNYTDKEAWFLLDQKIGGDNCSFSDDRREEYEVEEQPVNSLVIRVKKSEINAAKTYCYTWTGGRKWFGEYSEHKATRQEDGDYYYWQYPITGTVSSLDGVIFYDDSSQIDIQDKTRFKKETTLGIQERYGSNNIYTVDASGLEAPESKGVALYWHTGTTNSSGILFYQIENNGNWTNFYPNSDWSVKTGTKVNNEWYIVVLETSADIANFNQMVSANQGGIQWKGDGGTHEMLWKDNKYRKDQSKPAQFSSYGNLEYYQIWY